MWHPAGSPGFMSLERANRWLEELNESGYAGFSVSQSKVEQAVRYIERQEEHHRRYDFQQEYLEMLERHGL